MLWHGWSFSKVLEKFIPLLCYYEASASQELKQPNIIRFQVSVHFQRWIQQFKHIMEKIIQCKLTQLINRLLTLSWVHYLLQLTALLLQINSVFSTCAYSTCQCKFSRDSKQDQWVQINTICHPDNLGQYHCKYITCLFSTNPHNIFHWNTLLIQITSHTEKNRLQLDLWDWIHKFTGTNLACALPVQQTFS
jgi:hypothetical protein